MGRAPDQVAYFELTDTGRQVAGALAALDAFPGGTR